MIKRGILIFTTGLAIEVAVLWAIDYFAHLNLVGRIGWTSPVVWSYFFTGFLTAHWLILWKRLINKLMKPKQSSTTVASPKIQSSQTHTMPARMTV